MVERYVRRARYEEWSPEGGGGVVYHGTGLLVFFWSRKLVRFSMVVRIGGVGDKGRSGRRCVGSERSMYLVVLLERRRGGVRRAGKEKDCQRRHLRWMIDVETINQNPNKTVFGQSNRQLSQSDAPFPPSLRGSGLGIRVAPCDPPRRRASPPQRGRPDVNVLEGVWIPESKLCARASLLESVYSLRDCNHAEARLGVRALSTH